MKPGTPVTNIEPLRDGPHVIPPGTLGIVEWCDRARGEACVQFIGHILQRGVAVAALRVVDVPPVTTLRWLRADVDPELDALLQQRIEEGPPTGGGRLPCVMIPLEEEDGEEGEDADAYAADTTT